jgi:hypothetical protein
MMCYYASANIEHGSNSGELLNSLLKWARSADLAGLVAEDSAEIAGTSYPGRGCGRCQGP